MKRLEVKVYGRVQGVNFRASTRFLAKRLGLKGYVKNLDDGSVEIVAEGDKDKLNQLLAWAQKGPFLAKPTKVDFSFKEAQNNFNDFEIRF
jgi:acylphosphatase